jgi:hypothetical protein
MLRAGTITKEMHEAGKDFQAAFIVANLDPLRPIPILRCRAVGASRSSTSASSTRGGGCTNHWRRWADCPAPAGSCVWHVVGLQRSVREWAIRRGWGGRPVRQEQAQGILVTALGILAGHFGYGAAKRDSQRMLVRSWAAAFRSRSRNRRAAATAGRDPKPIFPNSSDLLALQIEAEIGTQEICWPARSRRLF